MAVHIPDVEGKTCVPGRETMLILLNPAQYQTKMLAGGQQVKKSVDTVIECSR